MRKNNAKEIQEEVFVEVDSKKKLNNKVNEMSNLSNAALTDLQEDSRLELERELYNE